MKTTKILQNIFLLGMLLIFNNSDASDAIGTDDASSNVIYFKVNQKIKLNRKLTKNVLKSTTTKSTNDRFEVSNIPTNIKLSIVRAMAERCDIVLESEMIEFLSVNMRTEANLLDEAPPGSNREFSVEVEVRHRATLDISVLTVTIFDFDNHYAKIESDGIICH